MMEEEKATNGAVTRHMLGPQFVNKLICDLNQSNEDSYKPWCIEDVSLFILPSKLGYDINQCKLVNSMHDNFSTSKKNLDDAMKHRFKELLVLMNPGLTKESASITLLHVDVPRQQNIHDCGIHVLKYMEIWDGSIKWQDKTMPDYQHKEILKIRQSLYVDGFDILKTRLEKRF
ncbi:hypothetical protein D0Y65_027907 [Glycine soja]|nr:hypothetical protein D0Y65_027907 [Glycine soja]RZB88736.1 hypothetical protein D0Y65_027907 [Glycine soja]RZB88737.1 hypothetical protein D0Y65_027907 [Glycine soja]